MEDDNESLAQCREQLQARLDIEKESGEGLNFDELRYRNLLQEHIDREVKAANKAIGKKDDAGKQRWYAMPLCVLQPLLDVFNAGKEKYGIFNCLNDFENPNERFWDANMRHANECQLDPLAIDDETGCYHEAARAFSSLMRIYHCKNTLKKP